MRRVVLDGRAAADDAVGADRDALAHDGEVADDHAVGERRAGEDDRARSRSCSPPPPSRPGSGSRRAVDWPPSAGRLPSTALSPTTVPAPIEQPSWTTALAPNSHALRDRHALADVQVGAAGIGAQGHAVSVTGCPPASSDDCIASSTSTTARPSRPLQRGIAALLDRVDELLALEPQRLVVRDPRDRDVAEAHAHVLAVGVGARRARGALVVDRDLAVGLHVVEDDHLLRADDGQLAHLVRVEPAQVEVRDGARREPEVAEDDVLDVRAHVALAARLDLDRAARRRGRAAPRCRARRGSRARSRRRAPGPGSGGCRRGSRSRRARPSRSARAPSRARGGRAAGGRPSAGGRPPRPPRRARARRRRWPRAASRRTRACRPRARAGRADGASARSWRPRSRRAPGRSSRSSKSAVKRACGYCGA